VSMPAQQPAPSSLSNERFDVIVVGGGVYGLMCCLEAARRRLRPLLVERSEIGSGTTGNSLRIIHGGLRYLQDLDLRRFSESVQERRWFLRHFPDLVEPLPCLMPLYNEGPRRTSVMRAALALNDALSARRNVGVRESRRLPRGRIVGPDEVRRIFPGVEVRDLRGGAVWFDGFSPKLPQLLAELRSWCEAMGTVVLEQVEACGLMESGGRVRGVLATDLVRASRLEFQSACVINAAGPWAQRFARDCGHDVPSLFAPSLAWNLGFRRPAPADHALAVRARRRGAQTYFLAPWEGRLVAGTGHAPWSGGVDTPELCPDRMARFLAELNEAAPSLELRMEEVEHAYVGLLPARHAGTEEVATRDVIYNHGARGGPAGFWSLIGIKLTTARRAAEKAVCQAFPGSTPIPESEFRRPT